MDNNSAQIKSLEDIIAMMDGHMMKGYQSKLPKKESANASVPSETSASQSPADMAEASSKEPSGEGEMDDAAMQELMKMYESEEDFVPGQAPVAITGVN